MATQQQRPSGTPGSAQESYAKLDPGYDDAAEKFWGSDTALTANRQDGNAFMKLICCRVWRKGQTWELTDTYSQVQGVPRLSLLILVLAGVVSFAIMCGTLIGCWFYPESLELSHRYMAGMNAWLFLFATFLTYMTMDCNEYLYRLCKRKTRYRLPSILKALTLDLGSSTGFYNLFYYGTLSSWVWPVTFILNFFLSKARHGKDIFYMDYNGYLAGANVVGIFLLGGWYMLFVLHGLYQTWCFADKVGTIMEHKVEEIIGAVDLAATASPTLMDDAVKVCEEKWREALSLFYTVNENFKQFWSFRGGGKIWISGIFFSSVTLTAAGVLAVFVPIWDRTDTQSVQWLESVFIIFALILLIAVTFLAKLTGKVNRFLAKAATMHKKSGIIKYRCAQVSHDFILAGSQMRLGVRFCGVRIDYPFVALFFLKVIVACPTAYQVYKKFVVGDS